MRQIPVDTSAASVMAAQPPQPKVKDRRTGEIAIDAETGTTLMTVNVMFAANDTVELLAVTVPKTGISGDLTMGTPVALTGLVARPWERDGRHGIAFRAVAVTSLVENAAKPKAA
ncbi:SCO3933 family regulatory protein [Streptomyces xantholiticus]|uniref:SCO3933 family regulatory protein n=1 Tax=Streptomyces xantholiticus TaxID=68285 RepID=UPI0016738B10|nr:hypothetical protein [Streptomyces xantholiticus]GGW60565.1 hypothetical protein GCM10010381_52320 [Streptomyces xantholiticus]